MDLLLQPPSILKLLHSLVCCYSQYMVCFTHSTISWACVKVPLVWTCTGFYTLGDSRFLQSGKAGASIMGLGLTAHTPSLRKCPFTFKAALPKHNSIVTLYTCKAKQDPPLLKQNYVFINTTFSCIILVTELKYTLSSVKLA